MVNAEIDFYKIVAKKKKEKKKDCNEQEWQKDCGEWKCARLLEIVERRNDMGWCLKRFTIISSSVNFVS